LLSFAKRHLLLLVALQFLSSNFSVLAESEKKAVVIFQPRLNVGGLGIDKFEAERLALKLRSLIWTELNKKGQYSLVDNSEVDEWIQAKKSANYEEILEKFKAVVAISPRVSFDASNTGNTRKVLFDRNRGVYSDVNLARVSFRIDDGSASVKTSESSLVENVRNISPVLSEEEGAFPIALMGIKGDINNVIISEADHCFRKLAQRLATAIDDYFPAQVAESKEVSPLKDESKSASKPIEDIQEINKPIRDKWALVVGISKFQDKRIPSLKYSSKDAIDFRNYLVKEAGFSTDHVRLLVNEQATGKRVMSELGDRFIARVAQPDDLVVLYFSTHGSPSSADIRKKNYIVAFDTERDNLFATGIEMQKIVEIIKDRANTGRVLLVLDACHSGSAETSAKAFGSEGNFDAESIAQGSGQLVICSSQPNERSWESTRYENGIFTRKLLDGLRMNGRSTKLDDAFQYLKTSVSSEAREAHNASQLPVLKSKWNGKELMLAAPPMSPRQVPLEVKSALEQDSTELISIPTKSKQGKDSFSPIRPITKKIKR